MQFLMGLNESYTTERVNILMMRPLSVVRQAYSLLIKVEKQREIRSSPQNVSNGMLINVDSSNISRNHIGRNFTNFKNRYKLKFKRMFYDYCKKIGHTKEKRYKLHGFPNNPKAGRDRRIFTSV